MNSPPHLSVSSPDCVSYLTINISNSLCILLLLLTVLAMTNYTWCSGFEPRPIRYFYQHHSSYIVWVRSQILSGSSPFRSYGQSYKELCYHVIFFLFALSTPVSFLNKLLISMVAFETPYLGEISPKPWNFFRDSNPGTLAYAYKAVTLANIPRRSPSNVINCRTSYRWCCSLMVQSLYHELPAQISSLANSIHQLYPLFLGGLYPQSKNYWKEI